jgi:hypothetical protein
VFETSQAKQCLCTRRLVYDTSRYVLVDVLTPAIDNTIFIGNLYFIENVGDTDAKLFFTQARKVPEEDAMREMRDRASTTPGRSGSTTAVPEDRQKPKSRKGSSMHP